jgi:linoleoyl-CoA desaturase
LKKVTFSDRAGFHSEVKKRVNEYFEENNLSRHANWRMVLKTVFIIFWVTGSYASLLLSSSLTMSIISAFALSQGFVLVGFNIMHDGLHGSYSKSPRLNRIVGLSLEMIGASGMLWRFKHNILHHTYTNINEFDDDLEAPGILRFSPEKQWRPCHRFQHWYAFPVYCLMSLSWVAKSDFQKYFSRKIGDYTLPKPSPAESALFFAAKAFYFGYMLVVPMFFHPILHVLIFFLIVHSFLGLSLATVFQLAHIVNDNTFPSPDETSGEISNEWAIHQVETTANFAPQSRFARFYCGGLNFQIEHHLFPRVCHIHYSAISKIVESTCHEFQVPYISFPTVLEAIKEHCRFLIHLGRKDVAGIPEAPSTVA